MTCLSLQLPAAAADVVTVVSECEQHKIMVSCTNAFWPPRNWWSKDNETTATKCTHSSIGHILSNIREHNKQKLDLRP